ncbi:MAG: 5'-nucleotidase C-terminal domain-containing protein [Bdellovibrionota bacterium]
MKKYVIRLLFAANTALTLACSAFAGNITLLHTNDVHSHYRPDKSILQLGGIARLKTAVDKLRSISPLSTLLIDAGDWSEGGIYYMAGTGEASLRIMEEIGYDLAVIGNHDWLNGPDVLLDVIRRAHQRFPLLAANVDLRSYSRAVEFSTQIKPYVIREINGVKVAFLGLITYEFAFDKYIEPVRITDPILQAKKLVPIIKKEADVIIAVSHNRIMMNKAILAAVPEISLIIGAHDHAKLTKPITVQRNNGTTGWLVEAGSFGKFLGKVDLSVTLEPLSGKSLVALNKYELIQMDETIQEDSVILNKLELLEQKIESLFGYPLFTDHIGHSDVELGKIGVENRLGNFITDSYRLETSTDIALEHAKFLAEEIYHGTINTADVINTLPHIYDPHTNKTWSLNILTIKGRTLRWLLNTFFSWNPISQRAPLSVSGLRFIYNPFTRKPSSPTNTPTTHSVPFRLIPQLPPNQEDSVIHDITVNGSALNDAQTYKIAVSKGTLDALTFLNDFFNEAVPIRGLVDTGIESWRSVASRIKAFSTLNIQNVPIDGRIRTQRYDLGIIHEDINLTVLKKTNTEIITDVSATVRNYGASTSAVGIKLNLLMNCNGPKLDKTPIYSDLSPYRQLPLLEPNEGVTVIWHNVVMPEMSGFYGVTLSISDAADDVNAINNETTRWFKFPR